MNIIVILENLSKLISYCVIFFGAIAVAKLVHNYYASLYGFLKKYGISRIQCVQVAIFCRKDMSNNMRKFMEFSIFQTKGECVVKDEWIKIIHEFKSKFIKALIPTNAIKIGNTFALTSENIKLAIGDYFKYIVKKKNLKRFSITQEDILEFITDVKVEQGYLVPLTPICSLQQRYNQDWTRILNKYVSTFSLNESLESTSTELFSFYTWLMWGPSVQIDSREGEYKICEYGLGDESMSLLMILSNSKICNNMWNQIVGSDIPDEMGVFVSSIVKIASTSNYFNNAMQNFGNQFATIINDITINEAENPFLLLAKDFEVNQKYEDSNYMFSAYIWAMLSYIKSNDENSMFSCDQSVVLFEHANIADKENVKFLKRALINKIISHLENVFDKRECNDRIYSLNWALSNKFLWEVAEELKKLQEDETYKYNEQMRERVKIDEGIPISTFIGNIDEDFDKSLQTVKYTNIDFANKDHLGLLGRFYCELYCLEFQDENERESIDNILAQDKKFKSDKQMYYHCIIATRGDKIVGGIIGDYFAKSNSGVIEFVVVDESERGNRVGSGLISHIIECMNIDAKKVKQEQVNYCFFEVENPAEILGVAEKNIAENRLFFWQKVLAKKIDINYIQPALDSGKESVSYLMLAVLLVNPKVSSKVIHKDIILNFIKEYYQHAMSVEDPINTNEYKQLQSQVKSEDVHLVNIV